MKTVTVPVDGIIMSLSRFAALDPGELSHGVVTFDIVQ